MGLRRHRKTQSVLGEVSKSSVDKTVDRKTLQRNNKNVDETIDQNNNEDEEPERAEDQPKSSQTMASLELVSCTRRHRLDRRRHRSCRNATNICAFAFNTKPIQLTDWQSNTIETDGQTEKKNEMKLQDIPIQVFFHAERVR